MYEFIQYIENTQYTKIENNSGQFFCPEYYKRGNLSNSRKCFTFILFSIFLEAAGSKNLRNSRELSGRI